MCHDNFEQSPVLWPREMCILRGAGCLYTRFLAPDFPIQTHPCILSHIYARATIYRWELRSPLYYLTFSYRNILPSVPLFVASLLNPCGLFSNSYKNFDYYCYYPHNCLWRKQCQVGKRWREIYQLSGEKYQHSGETYHRSREMGQRQTQNLRTSLITAK